MSSQMWMRDGKWLNRGQLEAYMKGESTAEGDIRAKQLKKVREEGKVDETAKAISDQKAKNDAPQDPALLEAVKAEFADLKAKKAWLRPETKARYKELKEVMSKLSQ